MKKLTLFLLLNFLILACNSRKKNINKNVNVIKDSVERTIKSQTKTISTINKNIAEFVPTSFVLSEPGGFEKSKGDLNKDGQEDIVILIKGTDKSKFFKDEYRGELDRNRRGIIVLFKKGGFYELASENFDCFSSESEDGGVYFPPDLEVAVEKNNLIISYSHGRYGYWKYTFRYNKTDFELIGYDSSENKGPVPRYITSINFLTKKKLTKDNLNKDDHGDNYEENFVDSWENITLKNLIRLTDIKDFDELNF